MSSIKIDKHNLLFKIGKYRFIIFNNFKLNNQKKLM